MDETPLEKRLATQRYFDHLSAAMRTVIEQDDVDLKDEEHLRIAAVFVSNVLTMSRVIGARYPGFNELESVAVAFHVLAELVTDRLWNEGFLVPQADEVA